MVWLSLHDCSGAIALLLPFEARTEGRDGSGGLPLGNPSCCILKKSKHFAATLRYRLGWSEASGWSGKRPTLIRTALAESWAAECFLDETAFSCVGRCAGWSGGYSRGFSPSGSPATHCFEGETRNWAGSRP